MRSAQCSNPHWHDICMDGQCACSCHLTEQELLTLRRRVEQAATPLFYAAMGYLLGVPVAFLNEAPPSRSAGPRSGESPDGLRSDALLGAAS